ncbi:MAG: hypothetical protein KGJ13_11305 [Patescibacteria group bacterium]|nr:hypothetical protein [Patescibacteria group bacterium]
MAKKIHDRRAHDTLAAGQYAPATIDDPYEAGEKITGLRQLRGDPLGRLHAHRQIDEAQYHAGRAYQQIWEIAERGAKAIDPTKEAVDGGLMPEPVTEAQRKALMSLSRAHRYLGQDTSALVHDLLIGGMGLDEIVQRRGFFGQHFRRKFGKQFRDGLDSLAKLWGFSNGERCAN